MGNLSSGVRDSLKKHKYIFENIGEIDTTKLILVKTEDYETGAYFKVIELGNDNIILCEKNNDTKNNTKTCENQNKLEKDDILYLSNLKINDKDKHTLEELLELEQKSAENNVESLLQKITIFKKKQFKEAFNKLCNFFIRKKKGSKKSKSEKLNNRPRESESDSNGPRKSDSDSNSNKGVIQNKNNQGKILTKKSSNKTKISKINAIEFNFDNVYGDQIEEKESDMKNIIQQFCNVDPDVITVMFIRNYRNHGVDSIMNNKQVYISDDRKIGIKIVPKNDYVIEPLLITNDEIIVKIGNSNQFINLEISNNKKSVSKNTLRVNYDDGEIVSSSTIKKLQSNDILGAKVNKYFVTGKKSLVSRIFRR